ncbi:MAG: hypothetical protein AAFY54_04635 [Cyanobacteria bacterium J06648_10]
MFSTVPLPPVRPISYRLTSKPQSDIDIPVDWVEFCRLMDIPSGLKFVNFEPYGYQRRLIASIEQRSVIVIKVRQCGYTLAVGSWFLKRALEGAVCLVISRTGDDASEVVKRIRKMVLANLDWAGLLLTNNLTDLEFSTGGRIVARPPTADAGRSLTNVAYVLIDEAQSIPNLDIAMGAASAVTEAVGQDARFIIMGTPPEMRSGYYWELLTDHNPDSINLDEVCDQVRDGAIEPYQEWIDDMGWAKVVQHFRAHPEHGKDPEAYLNKTRKRLNVPESQLQREYNLKVPKEGEVSIFRGEDIANAEIDIAPVEVSEETGQKWWISPAELEGQVFYVGCDPHNDGFAPDPDPAAMVGLLKFWDQSRDRYRYRLVYQYQKKYGGANVHLNRWADAIKKLNPIEVRVERNSAGATWCQTLIALCPGFLIEGCKVSSASRPGLVTILELALEREDLEFPADSSLGVELRNFVSISGKPQAAPGYHDDVLWATIHALVAAQYKNT